jgi:stage II sporulation protein D
LLRLVTATLVALALLATPAFAAKARFTIRGAGFGHGVGMSQYGAYGFAKQGRSYDRILRHYYRGTQLGTTDPAATVRVLLRSTGTASFSGAAQAGTRALDPSKTYQARRRGSAEVDLLSASGRRIATFAAPLQVSRADGVVTLGGSGAYRGVLEIRPDLFGGVNVINAVSLEDYIAGVVARESPSSWPAEALKAQAVAARTYAITTSKAGAGFEHYADTRSQVYGGVAAETASTNAAVAATRGQVVTYKGEPVVTFFFSTSGGRTENVENTNVGAGPKPWLKSVADPFDDISPKHRWKPTKLTLSAVGAKLSGLVKGRFRGIEVTKRGRSPRIVSANIVGSRGRTKVDGATLRARLGLLDTWAYFTTIASRKAPPSGTGGAGVAGPRPYAAITGSVIPAREGAEVQIQQLENGRWKRIASTAVRAGGSYSAAVASAGTYRAVFAGDAGAAVRIRR